MSRIFITGDVHYPIDTYKLNHLNFPATSLTKEDYVIICGDGGFVWDQGEYDQQAVKWADSRPYTVVYIDGNHENHEALKDFEIVDFHGAKAHKISDSLYHILRGEIFTINDQRYFCFGGAFSHDYLYRKEGVSWWQSELPTKEEIDYALDNLAKVNNRVDFIITHDIDEDTYNQMGYGKHDMSIYDSKYQNIQSFFNIIKENVEYNCWFAGHYHIDQYINNIQILYNQIIEIKSDTVVWYKGRMHEILESHLDINDIKKDPHIDNLYLSLKYNEIGTLETFRKYNDTVYPLKEFLEVLDTNNEQEAVVYLYKNYLIRLDE